MTDIEYKEMDKLTEDNDILLALAVYDWYFFHDQRVFELKKDLSLSASNKDIFKYYHTDKPDLFNMYHKIYADRYKAFLQNMISCF